MRNLVTRPDGPGTAFLQAVGATAIAVGVPIVGTTVIRYGAVAGLWRALAISLALSVAISLAAGSVYALWRMLQLWAYGRFTSGPGE